ncbi:MAG TPA: hypothetical protein VN903_12160 [Polyangia bacterium]|jgi:hypothetical protein|nr:hypothetical protein [Polyangia bacterium]
MLRALAIVLLLTATADAEKTAPTRKPPPGGSNFDGNPGRVPKPPAMVRGEQSSPAPHAKCDKTYARPFTVTRGGSKVQLRVVKLPPPRTPAGPPAPLTSGQVFEDASAVCRGLGNGWRVAVGSFGAAVLKEFQESDSAPLKAALAACPVTFRRVDVVCAPCAAGNRNCPCANRDISDWIFCEKP